MIVVSHVPRPLCFIAAFGLALLHSLRDELFGSEIGDIAGQLDLVGGDDSPGIGGGEFPFPRKDSSSAKDTLSPSTLPSSTSDSPMVGLDLASQRSSP